MKITGEEQGKFLPLRSRGGMQRLETATSVHSDVGRGVRHFVPRAEVVNSTGHTQAVGEKTGVVI
jgi:hypothetical protein